MRHIFSLALLAMTFSASAQWVVKEVNDDPFEPAYKICYNADASNHLLKLEEADGKILFYTSGGYVCDEYVAVSLSFKIDGEWERVDLRSCMVIKSKIVVLSQNILSENWKDKVERAESIAILINESHCDDERMLFDNSGASDALSAWSE